MSRYYEFKPRDQRCRCAICGRSTKAGDHSECSKKHDEHMVTTRDRYGATLKSRENARRKTAVKNYKNGKLPGWMFS